MKGKKRARRCWLLFVAAALLGIFVWWNNCVLTMTVIEVR